MTSPAVLRGRSWSWFRLQVEGLLAVPPVFVYDPQGRVHAVQQTRLALALTPADLPSFQLFKTTASGGAHPEE